MLHAEGAMLHIHRIRCYHYAEAFKIPFASPQARRRSADSVILRIDCEGGISGYGESAPRPYVTGETAASVVDLIAHRFAPHLFQTPCATLEDATCLLDRLEAIGREIAGQGYHSALGAVDLALINALEHAGHLTPKTLFPTAYRSELPFSASVPFLPLDAIRQYFPLLNDHLDIRVIKILIGEDSTANYERVKAICELIRRDQTLRLEANGKLTLAQVQSELRRLAPLGPTAIEEPLPRGDWEGLRRLKQSIDMAIVADESLISLQDAEALVAHQACDIFNIKISKCGGLLRSRAIAQLAAAHGIACQVGTHVGESELLELSGLRLAHGIPNFDCYGGGSSVLFSNLLLVRDPLAKPGSGGNPDRGPQDGAPSILPHCRLMADVARRD